MNENNLKKVKGDRYYGDAAKNYEVVRRKQGWWSTEQKEMQALLDLLPKGLSVVDIPFGTGRFVPYYLERGYQVYGLDSSDEMLKQARAILGEQMDGVHVERGFSTDLPFETDQFDMVVSTRFLRDIITFKDTKKTLSEFARVAKKYGILQMGVALTEPYEIPADDEKMGSRMSLAQVEALLREHGFKIVDSRYVKGTKDKSSEIRHFLCERV